MAELHARAKRAPALLQLTKKFWLTILSRSLGSHVTVRQLTRSPAPLQGSISRRVCW